MMRVSYSLPNSFSEKQWATQRLKDYLVKGYAVNQKRLEQLHQTIQLISEGGKIEDLQLNEAKELLEIIRKKHLVNSSASSMDSENIIKKSMAPRR